MKRRLVILKYPARFVPNEVDDLHCFQACVRMAWEGLRGKELPLDEAERMTGFRPGMQTWPFAGMLAFAQAGHMVRSIEDFYPERFVADPIDEIKRQADDDEVAEHVLSVTTVEREVALVKECLDHPNIRFEPRIPTFDEVREECQQPGTAVICNVNYMALAGRPGYTGHFVLLEEINGKVKLQNPGLPPLEHQEVSVERFLSAWREPSPTLANALVITAPEPEPATTR